jgi:hypothetical protein
MFLTAVATGLIVLTGIVGLSILGYMTVRRAIMRGIAGARAEFGSYLRAYFEAPDENTPSEFAKLVDAMSVTASRRVVNELKTTFMGMQSGDNRLEKAMEADVIKDMAISQSPLLESLLSMFPTLGRRLSKNPAAMQFLPGLLSKLGVGGGPGGGRDGGGGNGGGGSGNFNERLKRY